ncbi:transmembrane protein 234 homolog [Aspergillus udagawae]|uniref:Transmembrane protein 234 homolog n=1 Tax=Aspergillus udagawae TaxID=91492 RepID=A0A8H3NIT1_9EURO|nr:transmembrane protein 234 homolog [Aspergillus udagawae]
MDPDASVPVDEPSVFNYVLSFLLVGVAWGFTTPFIRRAAADFNARQEAHQKSQAQTVPETQPVQSTTELQDQSPPTTSATKNGDETEEGSEEESGEEDQPLTSNARSRTAAAADAGSSTPVPAWMKPKSTSSWLPTKIVTVFWTVVNLLRTPAYSIPLVINLTGSVWFFLLVGKHELSLTVPLANSSAFLFTVLGEWYVERKVIEKETWLGMALVLGGIGICVHSKNLS